MANSTPTPNAKNKNTPIIVLLAILIIAVIGVGAYFIIKDATKNNSPNTNSTSTTTQTETNSTSSDTNTTPTPNPNSTEAIEAGITYTEVRGDDFYIEAQTNGTISGTCEISLIPSAGGTTHSDTDKLNVHNKVSICDEDFDLNKITPGAYTVRVIINAQDGRTTTLEKSVNI